MNALVALLVAALAATAPDPSAHQAKTPPATRRAASAPAEFGVPGVVPVAQLWADFYARADEETAFREAKVADDLFPGKDGIDKTACKARRDDLDRAARRVPISFEVWYVRHECAAALDDTQRTDQSEQALAALTRYAFAGLPPDHGRSSIQVFQIDEAYALAQASGDTLLYDFFDLGDPGNGDPLVLGLLDPQTGRERELRFDFVSPVIAVRREGDEQHYPGERAGVARATIKSMAKNEPGTAEGEAQDLIDALAEDDPARMASLIKLARAGSYTAAIASARCLLDKDSPCAEQAVDVLLPFAEKGYAHPMLLIARAYGTGRGVRQDPEAAKTLLLGATKRIGEADAYAIYAGLGEVDAGGTPIDDLVLSVLARNADSGDALAQLTAASFSVVHHKDKTSGLDPRERAWLLSAERSGLHTAGIILASDAIERKDTAEASRYWMKWADKDADAASELAAAYEDGNIAGLPRDANLAMKWRRQAGMLGSIESTRIVASHYMALDTPDARTIGMRWMYSAAATGDVGGTLDLAYAMANTPSLGPDALQQGVAIYRAVMADHDSPRARRAFATLLMDGHGVDKDLVQARQLLLKDADNGDADSQLALARALFRNKLGKFEPSEVWDWVRKSDAGGNRSASLWLASAMFDGVNGMPADRRKALETFDKLTNTGSILAGNDYAWDLCTGPDPAFRDPVKGLATIAKVVKDSPVSTHLDTEASCLAATSDFPQAVDFQQRAIAALPPDSASTLAGMQARLALYKDRQTYVQDVVGGTSGAAASTAAK